jgi:dTDP-4-amino-4,6-dideoxy-D-galactose acyltransferase
MKTTRFCQYLEWDSDFFGRRIARLTVNRLTPKIVQQVMAWCKSNNIDCLYFLADANDKGTVRLAEAHKMCLVDIRVTLTRQIDDLPDVLKKVDQDEIRSSKPDDIPALQAIAKVNHHDTRFYYDLNFPKSLCDALYETWIKKSCNEYADVVLVAELQGCPVGYISCHLLNQFEGQIGLFGVSPGMQGKGMGKKLIKKSLFWFAEQGVKRVKVVTQGRNCQAQRLYQRAGFLTNSVHLWYHCWFLPNQAGGSA